MKSPLPVVFTAVVSALATVREHGLEHWQEARQAELFLETAERAHEIEATIDPDDDPRAVEGRWEEFVAWVDERERQVSAEIDPALYAEIYGDD